MERLINRDDRSRQLCFIHIPKTGGTTITHTIRKYFDCEPLNMINGHSMSHVYRKYLTDKIGKTPTFAIVRNPITWYESVYKMIISYSADHTNTDFKDTRRRGFNPIGHATFMYAPTFEGFINNMLKQAPDYCLEVHQNYMGNKLDRIDHIGHTENLFSDFYDICLRTGLFPISPPTVTREQILSEKSHGGRKHLNNRIVWGAGQQERIIDANIKLFDSPHFKQYLNGK